MEEKVGENLCRRKGGNWLVHRRRVSRQDGWKKGLRLSQRIREQEQARWMELKRRQELTWVGMSGNRGKLQELCSGMHFSQQVEIPEWKKTKAYFGTSLKCRLNIWFNDAFVNTQFSQNVGFLEFWFCLIVIAIILCIIFSPVHFWYLGVRFFL